MNVELERTRVNDKLASAREKSRKFAKCDHADPDMVREVGYSGSIPGAEPNPAAHGWTEQTLQCSVCGARRRLNVNQWHEEIGPWWDCQADRIAALKGALDALNEYVSPRALAREGCDPGHFTIRPLASRHVR